MNIVSIVGAEDLIVKEDVDVFILDPFRKVNSLLCYKELLNAENWHFYGIWSLLRCKINWNLEKFSHCCVKIDLR